MALPTKLGGLGLTDLTSIADHEHDASREITASMVQSIISQETVISQDPTSANTSINDIKRRKKEQQESNFARIHDALEPPSRRLLDCACELGASTWLSALPVEEHGFCLSKSSFRDALSLRYGWQLPGLSTKCACGKPFSVDHIMICHKGGLPTLQHNEVCDLTAALLAEMCKGVSVEPPLQALDDEEFNFCSSNCDDEVRLDIKVSDFWSKGRDAFFDVRVLYPIVPSYCQKELKAIYKQHKREKKRSCGERVCEAERASFTPLVFFVNGRNGKRMHNFLQEAS